MLIMQEIRCNSIRFCEGIYEANFLSLESVSVIGWLCYRHNLAVTAKSDGIKNLTDQFTWYRRNKRYNSQWPLFKFLFENEVCGVKRQSANNYAVISHTILIFRIWINWMSKRNQMIKFELNWSSGNVIRQIDECWTGLQNQHRDKDHTTFILSPVIKWPNMKTISAMTGQLLTVLS